MVNSSSSIFYSHDDSRLTSSGSPECYRADHKFSTGRLVVTRKVDVWSIGCIFSEVAVWIVRGRKALRDYRTQRRDALKDIPGLQDGDCFHDGEKMLALVVEQHSKLQGNFRQHDFITDRILDLIEEMLQDDASRPSAQDVLKRFQLRYAIAEQSLGNLQVSSSAGPRSIRNPQRKKTEPPVLPPDADPEIFNRQSTVSLEPRLISPQPLQEFGRHRHAYAPSLGSSPELSQSPASESISPFSGEPCRRSSSPQQSSHASPITAPDSPSSGLPRRGHFRSRSSIDDASAFGFIHSSPQQSLSSQLGGLYMSSEQGNSQIKRHTVTSDLSPTVLSMFGDSDPQSQPHTQHSSLYNHNEFGYHSNEHSNGLHSNALHSNGFQSNGPFMNYRQDTQATIPPKREVAPSEAIRSNDHASSPLNHINERPVQRLQALAQPLALSKSRPSTALPLRLPPQAFREDAPGAAETRSVIPRLTIEDAIKWRESKNNWEKSLLNSFRRTSPPKLPDDHALQGLENRDHVIIPSPIIISVTLTGPDIRYRRLEEYADTLG